MKVIISVSQSAGNESVGEMWTENHLFETTDTLQDVLDRIEEDSPPIRHTVTLQITGETP
jgi:hypothetical protein